MVQNKTGACYLSYFEYAMQLSCVFSFESSSIFLDNIDHSLTFNRTREGCTPSVFSPVSS